MATQLERVVQPDHETASGLDAVMRRHFLFETYEDMAQRAGLMPEEVEARFRELFSCGIRRKRLEVRRAYIASGPRLPDDDIGRRLGISRKQVVEIRSQLRQGGLYDGRKPGLPTRDGAQRRRARYAYVLEHYGTQSKQQIAEALRVSAETVRLDFGQLRRRGLVQPLYKCRLDYVAAHVGAPERQTAAELGISIYGVRFIKRKLRKLRANMNLLRCQVEKEIKNRYAPATGEYIVDCMRRALNVLELPQQRVLLENAGRFRDGELQPIFWHLVRTDVQGRARIIRKIESGVTDLKELERTN
jgi:DNA-binding CsgD family transcriptional regulator